MGPAPAQSAARPVRINPSQRRTYPGRMADFMVIQRGGHLGPRPSRSPACAWPPLARGSPVQTAG